MHQYTRVFRLTKFPHGYPDGYNLPEWAHACEYNDRGWCFAETAWATMTKSGRKCIDLGKFTGTRTHWLDIVTECIAGGGRPAPMLPDEFSKQLRMKRFTSGADYNVVNQLYEDAFYTQFKKATSLVYHNLSWGDDELLHVVKVMMSGAMAQLSELSFNHNKITDVGAARLADAITQGAAPALTQLEMVGNKGVSEAGMQRLQEVCDTINAKLLYIHEES